MSRSTNPVPLTITPASGSAAANINPAVGTSAALKRRKPGATSSSSSPSAGSTEKKKLGDREAEKRTTRRNEEEADADADADAKPAVMAWTARNQWMVYAVASGACAAFNGVFAKLTTNDLTGHIARGISGVLGLESFNGVLEIIVRCTFFGLNLVFNGVMWTFFTQALAKGNSTTQVSIMNTSTNFMITALLGLVIFSESLPPLWWIGASLLVAGNVVIGRKDEGDGGGGGGDEVDMVDMVAERDEEDEENAAERGRLRGLAPGVKDDEDVPLLGDLDDRDV